MSRKVIAFFFLVSVNLSGFSCLNTFHALDKEGDIHDLGFDEFIGFNMNFNPRIMSPKFSKLEQEIRETKSPYLLSDYAVLLLKAGKTQESLDLLISLNRNLPNEYKIAANLGTAYEIAGNLDSALHYIKRGMELNPAAHEGSEWVHIKILETKIALVDNPNFLSNRTVLELAEGQEKDEAVRKQLEIQIRERFPFSPEGNDPIMASLLIDLGDCYIETATYEHANAFYTIAQEYYGAPEKDVKDKLTRTLKLRASHRNVDVSDRNDDGSALKVEAIRYRSILDDNNDPPYEIDWSKINVDVPTLLTLVDMQMTVEEDQDIHVEETSVEEEKENEPEEVKSAYNWGIIAGASAVVVGLILYLVYRRKRKTV